MIILLQNVTTQFRRLFWHISSCKVQKSNFITKCNRLLLKSESGITKCGRFLLQSAPGIAKCGTLYYKVLQVLQSVTVITKWDVTMCILELNKVFMYNFHYHYIKNKYGNKSKLLFTDTDSLMYEIKTADVYEDFNSDKEMFDFTNYSTKSKYYHDSNKLVKYFC